MSTFALSLPFVRFAGSKTYPPFFVSFDFEYKYTLKIILRIKTPMLINNSGLYKLSGTNLNTIRTKNIAITAIEP